MAQVINTNSLSLITQNNHQQKPVCAVDFYRAPLFWSAH
ncbi:flagellin [Escherichia coli]|nr:flagellin [Escherichia coli]